MASPEAEYMLNVNPSASERDSKWSCHFSPVKSSCRCVPMVMVNAVPPTCCRATDQEHASSLDRPLMIQEWRCGVFPMRAVNYPYPGNRVSLCRTDACTQGPNAPAPGRSYATLSSSYIQAEQFVVGEEQTGEEIWLETIIRRMGRQEKTEPFDRTSSVSGKPSTGTTRQGGGPAYHSTHRHDLLPGKEGSAGFR